jgi:hypothetical protein
MNRLAHRGIICACLFAAASMTAVAQFKEIPPAPYTMAVARQKIRTLLDNFGPANQQQTADTLSGLLLWYRDLVDEELIAAWQGDKRANLPALMTPLADARVASAIIDFSWHQQRAATFNLALAPMFEDLMSRYSASADPFLRDLLAPAAGAPTPELPPPQVDAVCRILLDMRDTGNWKEIALQVLPRYRPAAQALLVQDLHGGNEEINYRAQFWLADLKWNLPGATPANDQPGPRIRPTPPTSTSDVLSQRPHIVGQPPASSEVGSAPRSAFSAAPFAVPYTGPRSGTLKCSGDPILPNAEYVFPGMPLGNIQVDLEGKPWDARLVPGQGQTQDLILRNKGSSPQKRCTVHWNLVP